jgi:integrase
MTAKTPGLLRTKRGIFFRSPAGRDTKAQHPEGSPEFWAQYAAHMNGTEPSRAAKPAAHLDRKVSQRLSLGGLAAAYFKSDHFTGLKRPGQQARRRYLEAICKSPGRASGKPRADLDAVSFEPVNVDAIHEDYVGSAIVKDAAVKALGVVFAWAIRKRLLNMANPVLGFEWKGKSKRGRAWTDQEVAAFEARWPVGTEARLAFGFARYVMMRRSDIRQMGPHVFAAPGRLKWTEVKNADSNVPGRKAPKTKPRDVPQHPELMKIVARYRWTNRPYYIGSRRDPSQMIHHDSFGRLWTEWCEAAGLPRACTVHGVRRWGARHLLRKGVSKRDIQALGGWTKQDMVDLYTQGVDEEPMLERAISAL